MNITLLKNIPKLIISSFKVFGIKGIGYTIEQKTHPTKEIVSYKSLWYKRDIYIRKGTSDLGEILLVLSGYEYEYLKNLSKIVGDKKLTILDIGANIGSFTLFISKYFNLGKSYTIEPDDGNSGILAKNLINIPYHNFLGVLYSSDGYVGFQNDIEKNALKIDNKNINKVKSYSMMTIFNHINEEVVDICKIDIEGGERDIILEENKKFFMRCKIVVIEYHFDDNHTTITPITEYFSSWDHKIIKKDEKLGLLYFTNTTL